ncbi:MAG TPA: hypothetical protein GX743_11870 [Actinomycetales bacterium]|nr:hypothetical protein [Actinomycetales bacterium]
MTSSLATIADALIEFILSLLRDPAAAAEFEEDPEAVLAEAGLEDICAADVRAVAPVVVDRPEVIIREVPVPVYQEPPPPPPAPVTPTPVRPDPVPQKPPPPPEIREIVREISSVTNNFQIDSRSTIIDQSVNQNIWAEGDVTQVFDQEAIAAVGDGAIAAGEDVVVDASETDVEVGDIGIGNTQTETTVTDSYNDKSTTTEVVGEVADSHNDSSTTVTTDTDVEDSFHSSIETEVTGSEVSGLEVAGPEVSGLELGSPEVGEPAAEAGAEPVLGAAVEPAPEVAPAVEAEADPVVGAGVEPSAGAEPAAEVDPSYDEFDAPEFEPAPQYTLDPVDPVDEVLSSEPLSADVEILPEPEPIEEQ